VAGMVSIKVMACRMLAEDRKFRNRTIGGKTLQREALAMEFGETRSFQASTRTIKLSMYIHNTTLNHKHIDERRFQLFPGAGVEKPSAWSVEFQVWRNSRLPHLGAVLGSEGVLPRNVGSSTGSRIT
jgi:hypothetical protein